MATAANALVVMTKVPEAGQSKTRLVPPLSFAEAADLSRALLLDQLNNLRDYGGAELFVAYTPESAAHSVENFLPQGFSSFAQQGNDLGERMREAFRYLFQRGFQSVVLIGSDLPAIPGEIFEQAFGSLRRPEIDVVLGPSKDGGYYLVGMKRLIAEIFEGITWSRDDVLACTMERLARQKLEHELLPLWYDVDTPEDVQHLCAHHAFRPDVMKNTAALLQDLRQRGKV